MKTNKEKNVMNRFKTGVRNTVITTAILGFLGGCGVMDRLEYVGKPPPLSEIKNPKASADYRPVSMPMPAPQSTETQPNSLWRKGARSFFKDQRAADVGDIITINVEITDNASIKNDTVRTRDNSETAGLTSFLGYEDRLTDVLPETLDAPGTQNLVNMGATTSNTGGGSISRTETINLKIAGVISQVLPNGNLVIHGKQEIAVNHEMRQLQISGIIRPEDIGATNEIEFEKIAEARVAYGGKGYISDVQQARYGQQFLDVILPF